MDTIQGVLKYQRPGADGKVRWAPPTALRRIDLILLDEGSQYEDSAPLSLQFILWVSPLIDTNVYSFLVMFRNSSECVLACDAIRIVYAGPK